MNFHKAIESFFNEDWEREHIQNQWENATNGRIVLAIIYLANVLKKNGEKND